MHESSHTFPMEQIQSSVQNFNVSFMKVYLVIIIKWQTIIAKQYKITSNTR